MAEMDSLQNVTASSGQEALQIQETLKGLNSQINNLNLQISQLQTQKLRLSYAAQRVENTVKDYAKNKISSQAKKVLVKAGTKYIAGSLFGLPGLIILGIVITIALIIALILIKAEEVKNDPRAVLEVVSQCGVNPDTEQCLTDLVKKKVDESVRCRNAEEDNAECK